jgi:hypothetical protein
MGDGVERFRRWKSRAQSGAWLAATGTNTDGVDATTGVRFRAGRVC